MGGIVSEVQKCWPVAICYKTYIVYRDFIIIEVLNYTIIQNLGLSLVRYRIVWPPLLLMA